MQSPGDIARVFTQKKMKKKMEFFFQKRYFFILNSQVMIDQLTLIFYFYEQEKMKKSLYLNVSDIFTKIPHISFDDHYFQKRINIIMES